VEDVMIERDLLVRTPHGEMQTFVCHPQRGGPHPVILFLMDAPGIREELRDMARRLASPGFYVVLPNLYYRSGVMELGPLPRRAEGPLIPKIMGLMNSLTNAMVMEDLGALMAVIDTDEAASRAGIGCVGYCMSGPFAVHAAAMWPERVAAAASIHGTRLVTDQPDSPHRIAGRARARLYFGCAEIDEDAPPDTMRLLQKTLESTGVDAEVEFYPGASHGFVFSQRDAYDKRSAERHWERLFELFQNIG
jgi:carboxymethylenebutenolidase